MGLLRLVGRAGSRLRAGQRSCSRRAPGAASEHPGHVRGMQRGPERGMQRGPERGMQRGPFSREPFSQMEEFMKDTERKFRRGMEDTMGSVMRNIPGRGLPGSGVVARSAQPGFGEMENVSTPEKYKLNLYFLNANPEDIKVTLKGHNLRVSGEAKVETETSKSSHEMSVEIQLPEDVEVAALESSLSQEGVLVVEAPRDPAASPEAPKPIPIERE